MTNQKTETTTTTTPANEEAKKASLAALKAQMNAQLIGHHFGPQEDPEAYNKPTNIVTASNGVFRVVKTPVAMFKTQLAENTKIGKTQNKHSIPGVSAMEEGVELTVPKIPFKYWLQVFNFYKDVDTKDKTEASVLFFWNTNDEQIPTQYTDNTAVKGLTEDGKLIVYCPRQKNSGGLSEFGHDGMVNWLRQNTTPLIETHSHHTMGAYFSGTDDANENMNQFYAVYGKIQSQEPQFAFRFCSGEHKVECDPSVLFDFPKIRKTVSTTEEFVGVEGVEPKVVEKVTEENFKGPWPVVDYPADWMEQHTVTKYTVRDYGYNYGKNKGGASKSPSGGKFHDYESDFYDSYGYGATGHGYYDSGYAGGGQGSEDKKYSSGQAATSQSLKKTSAEDLDTETVNVGDTKVEMFALSITNSFSDDEVKDLVTELCELGYDHVLLDIVKEANSYHDDSQIGRLLDIEE